jgi:hypothetical protein
VPLACPMRTLQEWMRHRDVAGAQRYADYAPHPHELQVAEAAFTARRSSDHRVNLR